jgi:hypothetical protein
VKSIDRTDKLHLHPNEPLPAPESLASASRGSKPERASLVQCRKPCKPVPVTELTENFSPIVRMAPPLLDSDMAGGDEGLPFVLSSWALSPLEPANLSIPGGNRHGSAENRSVSFMKVSPCYRLLPCELLSQLDINQVR